MIMVEGTDRNLTTVVVKLPLISTYHIQTLGIAQWPVRLQLG